MPLNIKDEDVHAQARRLAQLKGTSITAAVREALAAQLSQAERQARQPAPRRKADALLELARTCADALKPSGLTSDHADLYGDDGLPR